MNKASRGRCLCGHIRYAYDLEAVRWRAHCHCESCRRNCSAPITTWFGVALSAFRWDGPRPAAYKSSASATRYFCPRCGTPMAYRTTQRADEVHLYAASLIEPTDFAPQAHVFWAERLPWLHLADDLPRCEGGGQDAD